MSKTKIFTALLLSLFISATTIAADKNANFENRKQRVSENADKRISVLQQFKSCLHQSTDRAGIKACRETRKAEQAKLRASRKADSTARKQARADKRAAREAARAEKRASKQNK